MKTNVVQLVRDSCSGASQIERNPETVTAFNLMD